VSTLAARGRDALLLRPSARMWLLVGAVTLVGIGLRFADIGDKSLWVDEAFSVWIADQPLDQLWRVTLQIDTHPPLYYTLLHFWLQAGDGESTLRSLSALFGAATVPIMYLVGREIGGRGLGLLVALLQAVSPLHVWYAQQGRMYAMMSFFAAVALLCMVRLLVGGRSARSTLAYWAGFVVATVLVMLSHNTGVLLPATLAVFVAGVAVARTVADRRARRDPDTTHPLSRFGPPSRPGVDLRLWWTGLVAVLVLWVPWLPGFLAQTRRVDADFWIAPPTLGTLLAHGRDLLSAYAPAGAQPLLLAGAALLVALACWQLRHRRALLALLALLVVGPVVIELLVSMRRPIFYSQTLIWTSLPLTVLVGVGLLRLRRVVPPVDPRLASLRRRSTGHALGPLVVAAAGCLLALNLVSLDSYYRKPGVEDWRGAAGYLAAAMRPGEVLIFDAGWTKLAFEYYYRDTIGPAVEMRGMPVDPFDRGELEPRVIEADVARLDRIVDGRSRVWLVLSHDSYSDPDRIVTDRLGQRMHVVEQRDLAAIRIQAYEPN
jgi:hypothetical protein